MNLLKRYKYLLAVTIVGLVGFSAALRLNAAQASDERPDKAQFLTQLVSYIIGQWHYDPKAIDDSLSVSVYDEYLKTLDFGKRYFTQADSALLHRYRYDIDDQILAGDTMFFHSATSVFKTRMEMVAASLDSLLASPMDFTVEETLDPNDTTYARDMTQVMDRWRRYLKYNVLTRLYSDLKTEEDKASKDSTYVAKTAEELEKKAREAVLKNFRDYFKRIDELDEEELVLDVPQRLHDVFRPAHPVHGTPGGKRLQHQHLGTTGRHRSRLAAKGRLYHHCQHRAGIAGRQKRTAGGGRPDPGSGPRTR